MFLNDLDPQFVKSINYLYSTDSLAKTESTPLQFFLEEAIKNKNGAIKDLSAVVSLSFKQRIGEYKPFINAIEESKASNSDNELELDLLKEDLMCIVCNGMDVGARNRLLECSDCHSLYHQECHKPIVTVQDSYDSWMCQNCKDASKKTKLVEPTPPAPAVKVPTNTLKPSSTSHRHSSSSSYKSNAISTLKTDKYSKVNSSKSSSTTMPKSVTTTSATARTSVTPNINIISADKRIQIMKKKAAKRQEKRKHLPR